MRLCAWVVLVASVNVGLAARQDVVYMTYADAMPIVDALREDLWPAAFRGKTPAEIEASWPQWVVERDRTIRARVAEGDEDSLVHLMLFGTSFTKRPRATARDLVALASEPDVALGSLKPRMSDLVAALAAPGADERLQFAHDVIGRHGGDARQYLEARTRAWGATAPSAKMLLKPGGEPADPFTLFRGRGLSSDTSLFIDFATERALEDLKDEGVVRPGAIRRVAIVGPGLDFLDKQFGYDFYPQQTIQPFAVIDSLLRFGLASLDQLEVVAFDLNPRVIAHLQAARQRAATGYALVLPQSLERPWAPPVVEYWERLGNWIAQDAASGSSSRPRAPSPPPNAGGVKVRSLVVRPAALLATVPRDLNIVLQRAEPAAAEQQFDLIVATNILLYYDTFEQSLAAANVAAMLRPGGVFLTNNRIVELPGTPLESAGHTDVTYMALPGIGDTGDRIMWYQKR